MALLFDKGLHFLRFLEGILERHLFAFRGADDAFQLVYLREEGFEFVMEIEGGKSFFQVGTIEALFIVFLHVQGGIDRRQFLEEASLLGPGNDLGIGLARGGETFGFLEDFLEMAAFFQKFLRRLFADSRDALVVVGGIAGDSLEVRHLIGIQAELGILESLPCVLGRLG